MPTLITAGVDYPQFFDDLRAVIRHELLALGNAAPATAPQEEELLSVTEAAELLGVTVQTVHEWKRLGRLKYHKLGSRSYLKRSEVLAALSPQERTKKIGR